ncbi:MAG: 16S rRNA processing protein RimM [Sneathiella sp.]|nr:MAG: 16S rRNA processing protein RimM [Sneathiella sp.]
MPQTDKLLLGVIVGAKGLKGEMKVKTFTEAPEDISRYGPLEDAAGTNRFDLKMIGVSKGLPVVRIKGISDRNQAEALKGTELYVARDKLPETEDEDEYYHADLVGLQAIFKDGTRFGKILRLHEFGAGDILEILPDGKSEKASVLIPFTMEMVPEVNLEAGQVVLDLSEDFFDIPEKSEADAQE